MLENVFLRWSEYRSTYIACADFYCGISSHGDAAALERRTSRVRYGRSHLSVAADIIRSTGS
jgi:hypothetical protein